VVAVQKTGEAVRVEQLFLFAEELVAEPLVGQLAGNHRRDHDHGQQRQCQQGCQPDQPTVGFVGHGRHLLQGPELDFLVRQRGDDLVQNARQRRLRVAHAEIQERVARGVTPFDQVLVSQPRNVEIGHRRVLDQVIRIAPAHFAQGIHHVQAAHDLG